MRAVIFINTSWNIYNFRSGLVRELQKAGFEVHAIAPEDAYSLHLTAMGCVFHPVNMKNTGNNPWYDFHLILQVYRLYRKIKPKVALHYTVKPNIYGALVAHYLGIPSVSTISGLGTVFLTSGKTNKIAMMLYRRALKYPTKVFFHNRFDLELFKENGLLANENFNLIPGSGIDIRRFQSTKQAPPSPPFVYLMLARLIEEKGIREYLDAAQKLKSDGLEIKCQLLGAAEPNHKRGISVQEITNGSVEYLGETDDVRVFIENAHAIILPSYREGIPKSLLEAAAMQKPIISCDVPGCNEVVKNEINGLLCKAGNAADLEEKMKIMQAYSGEKLAEMGRAGRKLIKENFTEEQVVGTYLKTVKEII